MTADLTLSPDELQAITGYAQPAKQVEELRRQGFWRARRNMAGSVVLERRHYEAVCAGATHQPADDGPRLRAPTLRRAA
jgi:hypothetical protein